MTKKKKVVFIIDDDQYLLTLYERFFKIKNIDVRMAKDGEEGLNLVLANKPDFVILDVRMPKLNGVEVLQKIRENNECKNIPVLILSNYSPELYKEKFKLLNIVDYMVKTNVLPTDIVDYVRKYLEKVDKKSSPSTQ